MELLALEEVGADRYGAITPAEGPPRLFGGQVAAQSLRAATLSVGADRSVHSLHAYFVRPGRPGLPLHLVVERIRDGKSFATRRVTAVQGEEAIFVLDASFHVAETGFDWHVPLGDVPPPDEVPTRDLFGGRPPWVRRSDAAGAGSGTDRPVTDDPAPEGSTGSPTTTEASDPPRGRRPRAAQLFDMRPLHRGDHFAIHPAWVRLAEPIDDDPSLHACALTYVSDMAVVRAAVAPGAPLSWGGASLDHAVWFHRPFRVDEWLLFSAEPLSNYGARGLARGSFHREDGTLVASFVQECLLRSTGMPPPP